MTGIPMDDPEWTARNEAIKERIRSETYRRLKEATNDHAEVSDEQSVKMLNDMLATWENENLTYNDGWMAGMRDAADIAERIVSEAWEKYEESEVADSYIIGNCHGTMRVKYEIERAIGERIMGEKK